MPYVNIKITKGPEVTRAGKVELVAGVTKLLVEILGKRPEHVHVVVDEIDEQNWGFAGLLTDDYRRRSSADRG